MPRTKSTRGPTKEDLLRQCEKFNIVTRSRDTKAELVRLIEKHLDYIHTHQYDDWVDYERSYDRAYDRWWYDICCSTSRHRIVFILNEGRRLIPRALEPWT